MKVKLLRDARINHKAGEIVEVSPAECSFLISTGSAVKVSEAVKKEASTAEEKKTTIKRKTKIDETFDRYSNS